MTFTVYHHALLVYSTMLACGHLGPFSPCQLNVNVLHSHCEIISGAIWREIAVGQAAYKTGYCNLINAHKGMHAPGTVSLLDCVKYLDIIINTLMGQYYSACKWDSQHEQPFDVDC